VAQRHRLEFGMTDAGGELSPRSADVA
jgi:hypothetical protein